MFAGLRSGGLLAFMKLSRSHCPGPDEAPHCCDNMLKAALSPSALARAAPFSAIDEADDLLLRFTLVFHVEESSR
jgi:hypothetical protein